MSDPVELYQFTLPETLPGRDVGFGLPNPSPFCMKAWVWLTLAGVPFETRDFDPRTSPTGKAPFIRIDGEIVADSTAIAREVSLRRGVSLDAHWTDEERAKAALVQRVLEEHTYWGVLYQRWVDPAGWATYEPIIRSALPLPGPFARILTWFLRRKVRKEAWAQGLVRHSPDEIARRTLEDWAGVKALFVGPYAMGERVSTLDATVYTWLEQAIHPFWPGPVRDALVNDPVWQGYLERMRTTLSASDASLREPAR
jgi:glutathione S-transferase